MGFGSRTVVPPAGLREFSTDVDLRPANNLLARVSASLNPASGLITWRFRSIDPATGLPTTDPLAGFLPPNRTAAEGEGRVLFALKARNQLAMGTEIRNKASIIFDANSAIVTPEWLNTLDNAKPGSQVLALGAQSAATFQVKWSGTDQGSGIRDYTIFVSDNAGAYTAWQSQTTATQADYSGTAGHTYAFYSIARDLAGNVERNKDRRGSCDTGGWECIHHQRERWRGGGCRGSEWLSHGLDRGRCGRRVRVFRFGRGRHLCGDALEGQLFVHSGFGDVQ